MSQRSIPIFPLLAAERMIRNSSKEELTVDADGTGKEIRGVHHEPHQRAEHSECAENEAKPDEEFA